jgi:membrane protein
VNFANQLVVRLWLILGVFRRAVWAWWEDNALRLGASLAYYTLFAIAPVLLVAIAIAGLVFGPEAVRGEIVGQLRALLGQEGARAVQSMLEGASKRESGWIATIIGSVTFVFASTGAFLELQTVLNTIWRVKPDPNANLAAYIQDRIRSFGIVLAIGFLLLVSLAISAALAAANAWIGRRAPAVPLLWQALHGLVSIGVITVLFAMLYRFLPDVQLEWRDVITGAFVTAVLFSIGKQVIGLYLGQSSTASTYGAAGSVIVLLLWVYYSTQIMLLGAEFTRIYADSHGSRPRIESFAKPDPAAPVKAS